MARLVKCKGNCGKSYPSEELISKGVNRYCSSCIETMETEAENRQELYRIIRDIYRITHPTGRMMKQIKMYKEECNYTYEGMANTLKFLRNEGYRFNTEYDGLDVITYRYEQAQRFFKKQEEISFSIFESPNDEVKTEVIKTQKPNNVNVIKKERLINLEDLL